MKQKLTEAESFHNKVFAYLDRLPECKIAITKLCVPENMDKFLKVVKLYVERGTYNGYETKMEGGNIIKTDFMLPLQTKKYNEKMPLVR